MSRWRKAGLGLLLVTVVVVAGLAIALRYDAPCGETVIAAGGPASMQALMRHCYGGPDVLAFERVARPLAADGQVLVRVHAAAVNPLDWHYMRGKPFVMRLDSGLGSPKTPAMGVDFAGTVAAVGAGVTRFKVGDRVFGARDGALAEYLAIRDTSTIVAMPSRAAASGIGASGATTIRMPTLPCAARAFRNTASRILSTVAANVRPFHTIRNTRSS